jgi:hypothetical protein
MLAAIALACLIVGSWSAWNRHEVENWQSLIGLEAPILLVATALFRSVTQKWRVRGLTAVAFFAMSGTLAVIALLQHTVTHTASRVISAVAPALTADVSKMRSDYTAALDATGFKNDLVTIQPGGLDVAAIRRDADAARAATDDFQKREEGLAETFAKYLQAAPMDASSRANYIEKFRQKFDENKVVRDETWSARRSIIDAEQNLLEFLVARPGWTRATDGQILFYNPADAEKFKVLNRAYQNACSHEDVVLAKSAAAHSAAKAGNDDFNESLQTDIR